MAPVGGTWNKRSWIPVSCLRWDKARQAKLPTIYLSHSLARGGPPFRTIQEFHDGRLAGKDDREYTHFVLLVNTLPAAAAERVSST